MGLLVNAALTATVTVLAGTIFEFAVGRIRKRLFGILLGLCLLVLFGLFILPLALTRMDFETFIKEEAQEVSCVADIYLDGKSIGCTPKKNHYVLWGRHFYSIEKEHYDDRRGVSIDVSPYRATLVRKELYPKKGTISVEPHLLYGEPVRVVIKKDNKEVKSFGTHGINAAWDVKIPFGSYSVFVYKGDEIIMGRKIHLYCDKSHDIRL